MSKILGSALLMATAAWLYAGVAFALDITMVAEETSITLPGPLGPKPVTMWGLRDSVNKPAGDWVVPVFKTSDTVLNITLTNDLPDDTGSTLAKPTSLIIPGLRATETNAMVPTWTDNTVGSRNGDTTKRVRSLTREADNGGGTESYSWDLKPGTYIIQSGTHQAVQVQMGLFAVLIVYPPGTNNQAYGPSTSFTSEQTLTFSEIDSALHAAVAADDYGPGKTYTSMMAFDSDYYLINGQPYSAGAAPISLGAPGSILLRFVNAGYETRMPVLQGQYFSLVAEDGNLLPFPQELYSVELPAGKTKDALLNASQSELVALYDGRFNLTNEGVSGGGMFANLVVAANGSLIVPNGGEVWTRGRTYTVRWSLNPAANNYRLAYFDANNAVHSIGSAGNVNSFDWTIPLDVLAESGKNLRVAAFNGATRVGTDLSDATFTVIPHMFPNGGETLTKGMSYGLTWAPMAGADNYRLFFFDADNTPHLIANVGNVSNYTVTIPYDVLAESGKRFRVTAFSGVTKLPTVQWSDGSFTIATELYPNGGEILTVGSTPTLTWSAVAGATSYRLYYFDANNTPHVIAVVGNVTSYDWTIPASVVTEAGKRFRVTAFNAGTKLPDVQWSDGTFEVQ